MTHEKYSACTTADLYHLDELGLNNPYFGQAPITVDLNNEGRQDAVWLNISGPLRAFLNLADSPFITLRMPENTQYTGATVRLLSEPESYTRVVTNTVGL